MAFDLHPKQIRFDVMQNKHFDFEKVLRFFCERVEQGSDVTSAIVCNEFTMQLSLLMVIFIANALKIELLFLIRIGV